jgi:hypothetical protein
MLTFARLAYRDATNDEETAHFHPSPSCGGPMHISDLRAGVPTASSAIGTDQDRYRMSARADLCNANAVLRPGGSSTGRAALTGTRYNISSEANVCTASQTRAHEGFRNLTVRRTRDRDGQKEARLPPLQAFVTLLLGKLVTLRILQRVPTLSML